MSRSRRKIVTRDRLVKDLQTLGLERGDHVAVTLSFKSIGNVQGGPNAFIDSLLEGVGSEGTIMMNTFTRSFRITAIPPDYVFDSKSTVPYTGLVPKTLIKREGSIRSQHPTCSVAAIGSHAEYLTKDHDRNSNPFLPYEKLAQIGGKYLCIGIGNRLVAIRHEAQRKANLFQVPLFLGVNFKEPDGKKGVYIWKIPPCTDNMHNIMPKVEAKIILRRGKIGQADSIFADVGDLLEAMTEILTKEPQLSLCDDIFCFKCRELERRLNLYPNIKNPHFFQRNPLIRTTLFFINRVVLWQFRNAFDFDVEKNINIIQKGPLDLFLQIFLTIASRLLGRKQ